MEADIDEVSVLQTGAEQDGWKVTTEVVSSDDVILTRSAPTAEKHSLIWVWTLINQRQQKTADQRQRYCCSSVAGQDKGTKL